MNKKRVLVIGEVEGDNTLSTVETALQGGGYEVVRATPSFAAPLLRDEHFALVVAQEGLQGEGLELARAIRVQARHMPLLMLENGQRDFTQKDMRVQDLMGANHSARMVFYKGNSLSDAVVSNADEMTHEMVVHQAPSNNPQGGERHSIGRAGGEGRVVPDGGAPYWGAR